MGYRLCLGALATQLGADAARKTFVIEDSLAGIQSAKGAGLACLAVAHSYPAASLWQSGADAVVARLAAIDDAVVDALYRRAGAVTAA